MKILLVGQRRYTHSRTTVCPYTEIRHRIRPETPDRRSYSSTAKPSPRTWISDDMIPQSRKFAAICGKEAGIVGASQQKRADRGNLCSADTKGNRAVHFVFSPDSIFFTAHIF
jgi:hypothetical protein